jgi:hypothetical protein
VDLLEGVDRRAVGRRAVDRRADVLVPAFLLDLDEVDDLEEGRLACLIRVRKPRCSRRMAFNCLIVSFCKESRALSSAFSCRSNSFSIRPADVSNLFAIARRFFGLSCFVFAAMISLPSRSPSPVATVLLEVIPARTADTRPD